MAKAIAVLVAAGAGSRFRSSTPKQFLPLLGKPLLAHSLERLQRAGVIERVILVLPREGFRDASRFMRSYVGDESSVELVPGGDSRQASVSAGLRAISPGFDGLVAVHDGARPTVAPSLIARVVEAAAADGGAIAAVPVVETLKEVSKDLLIERTVARERFYRAQTPQCFRYAILKRALEKAEEDRFSGTDEATLVERLGVSIRIVPGSEENLKVTTPEDLERAEFYLRKVAT